VGAEKVSCDPKTGVYTITFSDKDAAARADTDLLNSDDQTRRGGVT
jgi:hypothetical protein